MTNPIDLEALTRAAEIAARKGWVTIPNAALMFPMHVSTLRSYIKQGWVRTGQVGKRQVVFLDEIARYKREGNWDSSKQVATPMVVEEGEQSSSSAIPYLE